jgi:hypothetical protein
MQIRRQRLFPIGALPVGIWPLVGRDSGRCMPAVFPPAPFSGFFGGCPAISRRCCPTQGIWRKRKIIEGGQGKGQQAAPACPDYNFIGRKNGVSLPPADFPKAQPMEFVLGTASPHAGLQDFRGLFS